LRSRPPTARSPSAPIMPSAPLRISCAPAMQPQPQALLSARSLNSLHIS
jgi:hypothetical protein